MKTAQAKARAPAALANGQLRRGGTRLFVDDVQLHVPAWVVDIESFRRWTDTDEFPERGYVWWLHGEVWADMSREQLFSHLAVKQEFFRVLGNLAKEDCPGMLIPDGLLLSNFEADISGNPDATYIAAETLDSNRVRLIEGARGGYVEIQGSPDMVLEVVSDSSVQKDLVTLYDAYCVARVTEYWLVDGRAEEPSFDILRYGAKGFKRSPKKHGWITSGIFGKSFPRRVGRDKSGRPAYTLDVR